MSIVICHGSTVTTLMKNSAWVSTGSAWPTIMVPGITSSGTIRNSRKIAVVVASEPMPSVSKKLVTNPTSRWSGPGASPSSRAPSRLVATQRIASSRPLAASAPSRIGTGFTGAAILRAMDPSGERP